MHEASDTTIYAVIIGMAVTNLGMRAVPMALLSQWRLPKGIVRWLSYVPISVMGALVASEVLRPSGRWQQPITNPGLYAAVVTMLVFRQSRSFLGATMAGIVSFVALRSLLG